jgi:REP element-mobilizing transposase RayT
MARLARPVFPGLPHHVTQRGNGRQQTFFDDEDYALYRALMREHCSAANVAVWAWCLMPNHVHAILVPSDEDGLRRALSRVHRTYAGRIHRRLRRTGHFWQGRFGCVAEDEEATRRLRRAESVGRPVGSDAFLDALERRYGRSVKPRRRGWPKRGAKGEEISALSP